ncbi:hypothetical protein ACHAW6_012465 [Cyclotella cf. meneghiniana]
MSSPTCDSKISSRFFLCSSFSLNCARKSWTCLVLSSSISFMALTRSFNCRFSHSRLAILSPTFNRGVNIPGWVVAMVVGLSKSVLFACSGSFVGHESFFLGVLLGVSTDSSARNASPSIF